MLNNELFKIVKNHLLTQGKPSYIPVEDEDTGELMEGDECAYRGLGTDKCAVGCLIKDEYYSVSMEGSILTETPVLKAVEKSLNAKLTPDNILLLRNLQQVHDRVMPAKWKDALATLAVMHNV